MKDLVHIWELKRVHIQVNLNFLDEINQRIRQKFKTKPKAYKRIFKKKEIKKLY